LKGLIAKEKSKKVVIIGAGPAGLTAAYDLCKAGINSVVIEKDTIVGGLARTVNFKGYHFDIGGHRFFTKVRLVEDMWHEVLGDDFVERKRLSRIYYDKKYYYYPFRPSNALLNLGLFNSFLVVLSYLKSQISPQKPERTFEQWVSNRFGKRLFEIFFKTYTEKVWGMPCDKISAEWAAQRIKGLSLLSALRDALLKDQSSSQTNIIKTLVNSFYYPKLGPGMMWEAVKNKVIENGSEILLGADVDKVYWSDSKIENIEIKTNEKRELIEGTHFISSMPLRELINKLEPTAPDKVKEAAMNLKYRDFLTVALIVNKRDVFPDNWIYMHDPKVKFGRIQNFKNWSPDMVPDQNKTCLGLEYFCFEGDDLWTMPDNKLIELAKEELGILGLVDKSLVVDGTVVRMPKAYPVYDPEYLESLKVIREFLSNFSNLQPVGRNGMHKYNNQDHSMLTAMLAVDNILGANYDLWQVNTDKEYHEEVTKDDVNNREYAKLASTQPLIPKSISAGYEKPTSEDLLVRAFARMDKFAFALAMGLTCALAIFLSTIWLIIRGISPTDPNFYLLSQYFFGYSVTFEGAVIGMGYSFLWGFIFGWLFAYLRNLCLGLYVHWIKRKAESLKFKNFLDYI